MNEITISSFGDLVEKLFDKFGIRKLSVSDHIMFFASFLMKIAFKKEHNAKL